VLGGFQGASDLAGLYILPCSCCTGNGSSALYYAWNHILSEDDGTVSVNMLMNRQSDWADVHSHLPYEGKATILNKTANTINVRIPGGVPMDKVSARLNDQQVTGLQIGRRLVFSNLQPGDAITVDFPVTQQTVRANIPGGLYCKGHPEILDQEYEVEFKGNTVVGINTIQGNSLITDYPIYTYQREHMKANEAPMAEQESHVAPFSLNWV